MDQPTTNLVVLKAPETSRGATQWAFPALTWWPLRCALHEVSRGADPVDLPCTDLVVFEVRVQVTAPAQLQHGGERVDVDLKDVQQADDARVAQRLVDVVLAHRVAHIGRLLGLVPGAVQLVDLDRHLPHALQVVRLRGTGASTVCNRAVVHTREALLLLRRAL